MKRGLPRRLRDRCAFVRRRLDGETALLMEEAAEALLDMMARLETLERRKKSGRPPKAKHAKRMGENTEYIRSLKAARLKERTGA